ncbi:MAG: hypothetical protein WCP12_02105 [bacterium]
MTMSNCRLMMKAFAGLITLVLLCGPALTVNAQNYFVAPTGSDSADGASWNTPFLTIQKGIDSANAGQTVAVSNGTYVLTTQLLLNKGITLQGFGGASNTVIDANLTGRILSISDNAAVIDGFTLKNGLSATAINGTGVNMTGGTLQNCTVSSCTNTASGTIRGGGIYMSGSGCLVTNCLIEKNYIGAEWAASKGSGVYLSAGKLLASTVKNNSLYQGRNNGGGAGVYVADAGSVSNCVISGNALTCLAPLNALGGGAYVDSGTVADCIITNNSCNVNRSAGGGGGVFVAGGGTVLNCMIAGNSIPCVDPTVATGGGGVYVDGGRVVGCVVSNNSSSYYRGTPGTFGGGVRMTGTSVVERCVITQNYLINNFHSARYGGGVACEGGVMRNCLIMGNKANAQGGGLYITGGTNENCTIVRNQCLADADGVGQYGGVYWTNTPTIVNAIVYNNTGAFENNILPTVGGLGQVTYSCAPSLTNGTGNVIADPLFVDSGSGSGTSFTPGDYRPVIGSPCEKTGLVSGWMSAALELAGLPRLSSGQVDMGAYAAVPPKSTYVAESGSDNNAGTSWEAPFRTIQKGIDAATALGTVSVSNGTYALTSQLALSKGCRLVGVGGREQTIIDANGSGRAISISNSAAVLDGFTLKNGRGTATGFNGAGVNMSGGTLRNCTVSYCTNIFQYAKGIGVYMEAGTIDTCIIENNEGYGSLSGYGGGGVYMAAGLLTNTVLRGNRSQNFGGAIRIEGGLVTDCVVSNNTVSTGVGGGLDGRAHGGGIYMTAGLVRNSALISNKNSPYNINTSLGGGVCLFGSGTVVSNCVIAGNRLENGPNNMPDSQGAGAYVAGGVLLSSQVTNNVALAGWYTSKGGGVFVTAGGSVSNCAIISNGANCNDAITRGGGVYVNWGTVVDCVVSNNWSAGYSTNNCTYGSGVYMTGTSLVERCVIARNYQVNLWNAARYGAGVACDGGTMRSCLIMGNRANSLGGGLYITGGTNENCTIVRNQCLFDNAVYGVGQYGGVYWTNTPVIVNAIVYNNTSSSGESNILAVVNGASGVTYSCAPSLTSGTGNITADPLFTASGSGSGTTFTPGDYRLAAGTPCRNKGLTDAWMKTATDLDRLPRVKDFLVDMGAYERQTASGSVIKFF